MDISRLKKYPSIMLLVHLREQIPAVHHHQAAGHVIRHRAGQEERRPGNLIRVTLPAQWDALGHDLGDRIEIQ